MRHWEKGIFRGMNRGDADQKCRLTQAFTSEFDRKVSEILIA